MRIVLITLAVGLLYTMVAILLSLVNASGENIASFILTFGFVLLPAFICVFVFHLVNKTFRWRGKPLTVLAQILLLAFIFNLVLFPISIPDFQRHQNNTAYTHYSSFGEYFKENMLESVLTATAFAIIIPLLNELFKNVIKPKVKQHAAN